MRRARLGRYALYQARDYLMDRGAPTALVGVLLGYLTAAPMLALANKQIELMPQRVIAKYGSLDAARIALIRDINEPFLRSFLGVIVYLGALLAMNGIVATDRTKGYYRFLFAKPVSPARYYGQAFAIHMLGFLVIAALLASVYGAFVWPLLSVNLLVVVAGMFLLYGGIIFALSAAFRGDWLILVMFTVLSSYLWDKFGQSDSALKAPLYFLPPLSRTTEIYYAVAKGSAVDWGLLEWFAGYGAACVIVGMFILRYRRMAVV
jgi:hypothetical protein